MRVLFAHCSDPRHANFDNAQSKTDSVIGKGGAKIKEIGTDARARLEEFFGVTVHLGLNVKVDGGWRDDQERLRKFGYTS